MGLMDVFREEETANLRLSTLYELLKQSAQKELIINGINCDVPHKYLREIITGNSESNIFSGVDNISSKEREK